MSDIQPVHGIHHVTAMASRPQPNLDFYVGVLGMRLVKRSVNQDDPGTYHLFYADGEGNPGSDLTFFPWPHLARGRDGPGQTSEVPLAVGRGTLEYWKDRLKAAGVEGAEVGERFGEHVLTFSDPDGLALALVQTRGERPFAVWEDGPVPEEAQIRGIHAVRIEVTDLGPTRDVLTGVLGFEGIGAEGDWHRFVAPAAGDPSSRSSDSGAIVEVRAVPGSGPAALGRGRVHHVAWRVPDDAAQLAVRSRVIQAGLHPTPVIDRFWFRSVYFREPGGVLYELATDGPGFAVDEDPARLGETLVLPPWLEARREAIEASLPELRPAGGVGDWRSG